MKYFYILTVQWTSKGQFRYSTFNGIYDASLGESRRNIYQQIHGNVCEQIKSSPGETITLYFHMEANKI